MTRKDDDTTRGLKITEHAIHTWLARKPQRTFSRPLTEDQLKQMGDWLDETITDTLEALERRVREYVGKTWDVELITSVG
jgi:hypothetical protein